MTNAIPGKQVSQSDIVAAAGRGTAATSSSAPVPEASASIATVPARPAIETSLAAWGCARRTAESIGASSSRVRHEVESHWRPA